MASGPNSGTKPGAGLQEPAQRDPADAEREEGKPDPQDETFEEQEARANEEVSPPANVLCSSLDETVMPPPPYLADDFKWFQDLVKRIADFLQIPPKKVKELHYKLLDILHTASSAHIALPVNQALLDPAKIVWHMPATIPPACKRADKKYFVPENNSEFLFSHSSPDSLVVDAFNKCGRQHHAKSITQKKVHKCLDQFGRKSYS
ncbi:hypothetical protein UY3_09510 [Chelonia mydas]|uniref:Uncharacterized protein n=1 Tax=Chelonia mydas TaxID=8469 RepID=M7B600_CHEMY|nr:hypothetical protein UY3_09510 [Chelonia mydas]